VWHCNISISSSCQSTLIILWNKMPNSGPKPEEVQFNLHYHNTRSISILFSNLSTSIFLVGACVHLFSTCMKAYCFQYPKNTTKEEYKSQSSSLCNSFQSLFTLTLLGPNIFSNILFTSTSNLCSSQNKGPCLRTI